MGGTQIPRKNSPSPLFPWLFAEGGDDDDRENTLFCAKGLRGIVGVQQGCWGTFTPTLLALGVWGKAPPKLSGSSIPFQRLWGETWATNLLAAKV